MKALTAHCAELTVMACMVRLQSIILIHLSGSVCRSHDCDDVSHDGSSSIRVLCMLVESCSKVLF